ncbi:hypothetical protein [Mesorhizobium sp. ANAO-SY3R2]|uniref:hypothetical protein n=1 Tax=Mesorhizobium sp. ANAO-SY3R2 TaxID=3166644 RepID=UPI00366C10EB
MMEEARSGPANGRAFGEIARVASALAHVLDGFDESAWIDATLVPAEMRKLSVSPHFGRSIRAIATRAVTGADFNVSATQFFALAADPRGRLALKLVSAPAEELEQVSLLVAAAILHRAILHTTAKAERQRVRLALGPAAFMLATQEAPVLYAGLMTPDGDNLLLSILSAGADEKDVQRGFVRFGLAALLRLTEAVAPGIERLLERRLPPDLRPSLNGAPPELDCSLFVKLIRRRMPSWSATIG